jgi:iron(III)-salmochelin esterase
MPLRAQVPAGTARPFPLPRARGGSRFAVAALLCAFAAPACVEKPAEPEERQTSPAAATGALEARAPVEQLGARELSWSFTEGPFGATEVVVSIPARAEAAQRFPVLVAFHGRGESLKKPRVGARGWLDDYQLSRALARIVAPPLAPDDFAGFVSAQRLALINRTLGAEPYQGLIVVCPFLPDILRGAQTFEQAEALASFIVDVILPRVYAKSPAIGSGASTGIDGVSLGARAALLIGALRPQAFASVSGLQPAIDGSEIERFVGLLRAARERNPGLYLRLLTSDEDYYLDVTRRLSNGLDAAGVVHEFDNVLGTHSYRFNRGPGAYEMLLFHDRVLRGLLPI